ncbi:MAG TPA: hypothetical protein VH415_04030 [Nitrososphaeraceae archaeon]|jgi:hypothetical protein
MEDIKDIRADIGIDEKYERILKDYDPTLVIAFFHYDARMDAVLFEIGFLCGLYGTKNIGHRLRILYEPQFKFKKMTAYIKTLFPKIHYASFDDSDKYTESAKLIDVFVGTIQVIYSLAAARIPLAGISVAVRLDMSASQP